MGFGIADGVVDVLQPVPVGVARRDLFSVCLGERDLGLGRHCEVRVKTRKEKKWCVIECSASGRRHLKLEGRCEVAEQPWGPISVLGFPPVTSPNTRPTLLEKLYEPTD